MATHPPPEGRPEPDEDDGLSDLARAYRKAGPFLHLGWSLAGSVGFGTLGGWWLDQKLDTTPWLLLVGALLGMIAGFFELFRTLSKL